MDNLKKLGKVGLLGLSMALTPFALQAAIDGTVNGSDSYTSTFLFDLIDDGGDAHCMASLADPTGCGQLLVSTNNNKVQMALVLPQSLKDNTYGANSTDYAKPGDNFKEQSFKSLTGSDKLKISFDDGAGAVSQLKMDFLHGFGDKEDGPVYKGGFTGEDDSFDDNPANRPSWAIAAATSMGWNYESSNPDGINAPDHFGEGADSPGAGDAALAFWEFAHIYEWEVDDSVFGGTFDISQVSFSSSEDGIHLSPKKGDFNNAFCTPGQPGCGFIPCTPGTPGCPPGGTGPGPGPGPVPVPGTLFLMMLGLGVLIRSKATSFLDKTRSKRRQ